MDESTPIPPTEEPNPPQPAQPASTGAVRVRYTEQPGIDTPVEGAGRWWHDRTEFTLPAADAAKLDGTPGFTLLGAADLPARPTP